MKKTSKSQARQLPISQKAYESFRERIKRINNWYALEATNMLRMLDDYLEGDSEPGGGASLIHNIAFLFLREEIDRAMARSARARENARRRRERKEQERKERERAEAAARQAAEQEEEVAVPREDAGIGVSVREEERLVMALDKLSDIRSGTTAREGHIPISSARDRICGSDTWCGGAG